MKELNRNVQASSFPTTPPFHATFKLPIHHSILSLSSLLSLSTTKYSYFRNVHYYLLIKFFSTQLIGTGSWSLLDLGMLFHSNSENVNILTIILS